MRFFEKINEDTRHCIVCQGRFPNNRYVVSDDILCICDNCWDDIDQYKSPAVFEGKHGIEFLISAYPYSGVLRDTFKDYKFYGQRTYYTIFAVLLYEAAVNFIKSDDFDLIVPVPLSVERMKERGFNQSAMVSGVSAQKLDIELSERALFRVRNTLRQSELSSADRYKNVKGAFLADRTVVSGKRILIVDDIYTRGATMRECAKVLSDAGATLCAGLTIFKSHIPQKQLPKYNFGDNITKN